jgi:crotonobetainyl-CoA:carnitine CoA-transferase CaiB-like acyl-CoA transferase
MLALAAGSDGAPVPPPALIADIGGGTYPAVINILLALRERDRTGKGCKLDIAMGDNLFTFMYWAVGNGEVAGEWPTPGGDLVTGGSPRYNVYRTRDGKYVAAAPLEQKFWENFCAVVGLSADEQDDSRDAKKTKLAIAEKIAAKTADEWRALFAGKDVCCNLMASVQDALQDAHFISRGVFASRLAAGGKTMTALPVPVAPQFRAQPASAGYPALGEANSMLQRKA